MLLRSKRRISVWRWGQQNGCDQGSGRHGRDGRQLRLHCRSGGGGAGVFDNIRKTVHFLLPCNVSEVLVMLFAALLGLPLPLLPIQILWMNLVTDGIPALALAVDPKAPDLMQRLPSLPDARLLDDGRLLAIGAEGLMLSVIALGAFS